MNYSKLATPFRSGRPSICFDRSVGPIDLLNPRQTGKQHPHSFHSLEPARLEHCRRTFIVSPPIQTPFVGQDLSRPACATWYASESRSCCASTQTSPKLASQTQSSRPGQSIASRTGPATKCTNTGTHTKKGWTNQFHATERARPYWLVKVFIWPPVAAACSRPTRGFHLAKFP